MNNRQVMSIYRAMAILIVASPIALNVVFAGGLVMSLLYVPLTSLTLAVITVFIDSQLEKRLKGKPSGALHNICCLKRVNSAFTGPSTKKLHKAA